MEIRYYFCVEFIIYSIIVLFYKYFFYMFKIYFLKVIYIEEIIESVFIIFSIRYKWGRKNVWIRFI